MIIKLNKIDVMKIHMKKEEIKKAFSSYDKFVMYEIMFKFQSIINDMYQHIMSNEPDWGDKNDN